MHQIFMIVMGVLYVLAYLFGISYKTVNIYVYFVLYPSTFFLFLKHKIKYFLVATTLFFFLVPNFESVSSKFFDLCVVFLNKIADIFDSNYINISIYLCVVIPIVLYIPFIIYKYGLKKLYLALMIISATSILYLIFIYPSFKNILLYALSKTSNTTL